MDIDETDGWGESRFLILIFLKIIKEKKNRYKKKGKVVFLYE